MALKKIGALWRKESAKNKYLSGEIEIDGKKTKILIFANIDRRNQNQPVYLIYELFDDVKNPNLLNS